MSKRPAHGQSNPDHPAAKADTRHDKNGDGPHYATWLLVCYQAGDTGMRPLAPGTVFWESADVWTQGSQGVNQPVVNEPTQVFARVTNLGMQEATPVTIKYWWADPSVAIVEDPTKLIGEITGALVPANSSTVFPCPTDWIPIEVNNGHECLVVEAFIPVFDPLTAPMQPVNDRHVGQKNEQLLTLQPGQMFQFHLNAHNFTEAEHQIVIEARPGIIPRNFQRRFGTPEMWRTELLDPMRPLPVTIHVDTKPARTAAHSKSAARRLSSRIADISCLAPPQASATQLFGPGEVRRITIAGALPRSAQPGEVYVMRISQRIGEAVAGGYTLYITLGDGKRR